MSDADPAAPQSGPTPRSPAVDALTAARNAGDDAQVLRLAERFLADVEDRAQVCGEDAFLAGVHALAATQTCRTAREAAPWADRAARLLARSDRLDLRSSVGAVVTAYATVADLADDSAEARVAAEGATRAAAICPEPQPQTDGAVAVCWTNLARRSPELETRSEALRQVRALHARHAEPVETIDEALAQSLFMWGALQTGGASTHVHLLTEIEDLRARHPRSGPLAAALAIATWNAASAGVQGLRANDLATHFEEIATQIPDQEFDLDGVIARFLERALEETLAGAPTWEECEALATRLERVATRQSPPVPWIDAAWVSAFRTPLLSARPAAERRAIVEHCARVSARHGTPVLTIDENWASVVIYSAAADANADAWRAALAQVNEIAARHPDQTAPDTALQRGREICASQLERAP